MHPTRRHLLCALTGALLLAACAAPGDGGRDGLTVRGSLVHRERIALPPEAIAVVELREGTEGRVVAESRQPLGGRQVPIPFELMAQRRAPAADALTVRGAIFVDGRPAWVSEPTAIAAGAGPVDVGALMLVRHQPLAFASKLKCGHRSARFGVGKRDGKDVPQLAVGGRRFDMKEVVAASGARYEAIDDPRASVWDKGRLATVVIEGETWPECEVAPDSGGS
jgi:uncharacterized lipoprotein YbaY/membrane-bound inhibitor of C-type lysozyme